MKQNHRLPRAAEVLSQMMRAMHVKGTSQKGASLLLLPLVVLAELRTPLWQGRSQQGWGKWCGDVWSGATKPWL